MAGRAGPIFGKGTSEEVIAAFVDSARRSRSSEALASLLPERHPLYEGRGTNQTMRLRGYILAAFETAGLPDSALPYVFDDLQNSQEPYLVAAAAVALRGSERPFAGAVPYLLKAAANIETGDDAVTFESYKARPSTSKKTTALAEIFKTVGWLGIHGNEAVPHLRELLARKGRPFSAPVRAAIRKAVKDIEGDAPAAGGDCCPVPPGFRMFAHGDRERERDVRGVEFEDQDGNRFTYGDFFTGKPSVAVFFYTRCDNPNKCSLTVTKLGWLQTALREQGLEKKVKTAAITYDPGFDRPQRLKTYAQGRGVLTDAENRVMRAPSGMRSLREHFRLGVNFIGSLVNRHRIELYILDAEGKIAASFTRMQWEVDEVAGRLAKLVEEGANVNAKEKRPLSCSPIFSYSARAYEWAVSFLVPIAVVFFPKCPVCWMAYLSLFGITGLQTIPYSPWLLPVFVILMLVNLLSVYRRGIYQKTFTPFYLSLTGVLLVLIPGMWLEITWASYLGMAFLFSGSLISVLTYGKKESLGSVGASYL